MANNTSLELYGNKFELKGKELTKEVKVIIKSIMDSDKASWKYCHAVARIARQELWKTDFKNQKGFAEFLNITPSRITQYVAASDFVNSELAKAFDLNDSNTSVENARIMQTVQVKGEKERLTGKFIQWATDEGIKLPFISVRKLRDAVKDFINDYTAVETEAVETEAVETEAVETEAETPEARIGMKYVFSVYEVEDKLTDSVSMRIVSIDADGEHVETMSPEEYANMLMDIANAIMKKAVSDELERDIKELKADHEQYEEKANK